MISKDIFGIKDWIASYVSNARSNGIAIGISGGIDSAVVAKLAIDAIGKSRVHGLILPCQSSIADIENGRMVCEWLDIKYDIIDLSPIFVTLDNILRRDLMTDTNQLTQANIKSRLRMVITMGFCNQLNLLNAGTTNKSEFMIGYFTKYGDGGVDIEPIADFYKTEIFEMAKLLGVPQKIIDRKPSAGLWEGQTDEGEIGMTYPVLDAMLMLIDNNLLANLDLESKDVKRVLEMIYKSEHKKHMPPSYKR